MPDPTAPAVEMLWEADAWALVPPGDDPTGWRSSALDHLAGVARAVTPGL